MFREYRASQRDILNTYTKHAAYEQPSERCTGTMIILPLPNKCSNARTCAAAHVITIRALATTQIAANINTHTHPDNHTLITCKWSSGSFARRAESFPTLLRPFRKSQRDQATGASRDAASRERVLVLVLTVNAHADRECTQNYGACSGSACASIDCRGDKYVRSDMTNDRHV